MTLENDAGELERGMERKEGRKEGWIEEVTLNIINTGGGRDQFEGGLLIGKDV